uniref:Aminotransferase-like plant mobile domain-containing protein n=1 Tax=Solanum lycopersicum TaxID=4081 RepID=A0A3Q7F0A0_SOLLC
MAANNAYQLDPGPLDPSVLTGQLTHRSRDIWIGNDNMILNTRKCDGKFWDLVNEHPIHPRVLDVIKLSRLCGVYRSHRPVINRSLITALVERWRPETHTFHFRTGESTITLQDVEILYGLPVKGNAVVGYEPQRSVVDWQNICQRLLGFSPQPQDFEHSILKVSALNAHLRLQPRLPDLATQDMVNEKARCYMFWIIAGLLLADTSGGLLKLMYLPMLEDITTVRIWAWERVTVLTPQIVVKRDTRNIFPVGLPRGPHAARWYAHFSWTDTTKHVLRVLRDALDSMTEDQFIWEPYSSDIIESLPEYCRVGRDIWRARVPIFCWDVVEVYLPDRVMRQFGLVQAIPSSFAFDATHFNHDRRGRSNTNWELEHAQWLHFCNHIDQYVWNAPILHESLRIQFCCSCLNFKQSKAKFLST